MSALTILRLVIDRSINAAVRFYSHALTIMNTVTDVDQLLATFSAVLPVESCAMTASVGRILREEVKTDRDLPPYDRVTMDGVAISSNGVGRGDEPLRLESEVFAGEVRGKLLDPDRGAVRVATGSVLPVGSDAVVPVEDLKIEDRLIWLQQRGQIEVGQNIHKQGSDARSGTTVLEPGHRLSVADIAVLASVGRVQIDVSQRPRLAVISTGDELVEVDEEIQPHQIRRSNIYAVGTALTALGYQVESQHLPDDVDLLASGVSKSLEKNDVVITTGGVSQGNADFLPGIFAELGVDCYLHGVRQKPGKPLWIGGTSTGKKVFALPGNPVSVMMCLYRYVVPFLERLEGSNPIPKLKARLIETFRFSPPLTVFLPVVLDFVNGTLNVRPAPSQNSGDFLSLVGTDGFVELSSQQQTFCAGSVVPLYLWQPARWR